jgi:hypothetical protein
MVMADAHVWLILLFYIQNLSGLDFAGGLLLFSPFSPVRVDNFEIEMK